ncbi:MAG: glutaredoxin family protein [Candidatus Accumulibacter sp. UW26]|jgi:glutaredoxin
MFTACSTRVAACLRRVHRARLLPLAALLLAAPALSADTTYRWIDPNTGGTVISDLPPPPDARQVTRYTGKISDDERPLPYGVRQAMEKFPVILYTTSGCLAVCKQARELLNGRGVPFSERVLNSEQEVADIDQQLGGEAVMPSLVVGRQSARGFAPATWNALLDAATYPTTSPYRVRPSANPAP